MAVLDNIQRSATGPRPRLGLLFLIVVVGHIILISTQVQSRTGVPVLEAATFEAFARVQRGTAAVVLGIRDIFSNYVVLRGARQENEVLRQRVTELELRVQELRAQAQKSEELQALLDLRPTLPAPVLAAEVIAGYGEAGMLTVTIDRGARDGVKENMAVVGPAGVIGRTIGPVASHACRVQLLIDENAAIGAVVERTGVGGMVVGWRGDPPLRMDLVSNLDDVQPGDAVVTSGVEGIYPKGLNIGRVETSERGSQLYRNITVRPFVNFRAIDNVLVVLREARPAGLEDSPPPAAAGGAR